MKSFEARLEFLTEERDQGNELIESLRVQLDNEMGELQASVEEVEKLKKETIKLSKELSTVNEQTSNKVRELETQKNQLSAIIDQKKTEITKYKSNIVVLESEVTDKVAACEDLNVEVEKLQHASNAGTITPPSNFFSSSLLLLLLLISLLHFQSSIREDTYRPFAWSNLRVAGTDNTTEFKIGRFIKGERATSWKYQQYY